MGSECRTLHVQILKPTNTYCDKKKTIKRCIMEWGYGVHAKDSKSKIIKTCLVFVPQIAKKSHLIIHFNSRGLLGQ